MTNVIDHPELHQPPLTVNGLPDGRVHLETQGIVWVSNDLTQSIQLLMAIAEKAGIPLTIYA